MKTLEILKCNPKELKADNVIEIELTEAKESQGKNIQLLRNIKVEEFFSDFINEKRNRNFSPY